MKEEKKEKKRKEGLKEGRLEGILIRHVISLWWWGEGGGYPARPPTGLLRSHGGGKGLRARVGGGWQRTRNTGKG